MWWLTGLFAACTAVAGWFATHGDSGAPTAVVGAGICTIICATLALVERR
jgi:hypothetical protein